jgi:hypothetical protein
MFLLVSLAPGSLTPGPVPRVTNVRFAFYSFVVAGLPLNANLSSNVVVGDLISTPPLRFVFAPKTRIRPPKTLKTLISPFFSKTAGASLYRGAVRTQRECAIDLSNQLSGNC